MSGGYRYEVRSYNNTMAQPVAQPLAEKHQPYIPNTDNYLVKNERIIEKVHSPIKYGVEGNRWRTGFSSPVVVDDRPRKVEEFVTQIQTDVSSQPHLLKPGYLTNTNRSTPVSDFSPKFVTSENNPWLRNSHDSPEPRSPWTSPQLGRTTSPGNWTTTTTKITTLTKPTNDIKEAVNYLTGSCCNGLGYQEMEQYEDVINSREAKRRYGEFNGLLMGGGGESYVGTIDSREALRKYGGAAV